MNTINSLNVRHALANTELSAIFLVGRNVSFTGEKLSYKVMAVSKKYAVVSRPLNKREDADLLHHQVRMGAFCSFTEAFEFNRHACVYSIIDFEMNTKAPLNLVFGIYDYSTPKGCQKVIKDLEKGKVGLSNRNMIELSVDFERLK